MVISVVERPGVKTGGRVTANKKTVLKTELEILKWQTI